MSTRHITRIMANVLSLMALSSTCLAGTNAAPGHSMTVTGTTGACWTYTMVTSYVAQLGPLYDKETFEIITNASCIEKLPVPESLDQFVQSLYSFSLTNVCKESFVHDILSCMDTTNETITDILLWGFTNYAILAYQLPGTYDENAVKCIYNDRSSASVRGLQSIGTPSVIGKLNKVIRKLKDEGIDIDKPDWTISPDRFPIEAKDWLLNSPEERLRLGMANAWLHSSRPETPGLIELHAQWLETLPPDRPFWSDGGKNSYKREYIRDLRKWASTYAVEYQRWIEDGKSKSLDYGCYRDENWPRYKKEREAERAKERAAQAGSTNNVTRNKP